MRLFSVSTALALGAFAATSTAYPGVEPLPPATPLRLDEIAELFPLAPYRQAAGLRFEDRYATSPHTSWIRRAWYHLDWELMLPDPVLLGERPPIHPRPGCEAPRDPVASRLLTEPA